MRPRLACSAGSAARTTAAVPSRFTCTTRSHSAPGTSSIRPQASVPAAVTTASSPSPASARTASSAARVSARSTTAAGASASGGHRVGARVDPVEQERCAARGRDRGGDGPAEPGRGAGDEHAAQRSDGARFDRGVLVGGCLDGRLDGCHGGPPWSGGGERGVFPVGLGGGGQRRLDGAAQHVERRRGASPAPSRCRPGRQTASSHSRASGLGPGPVSAQLVAPHRPGGLRRREQVAGCARWWTAGSARRRGGRARGPAGRTPARSRSRCRWR